MSLAARPPADGLRELVRHIVQRDVLRASAAKSRGWMVLILDAAAARVLTPVLGLYDLVEERVTLVESLEKKRQPFPDMTAVYVVAATTESVARVLASMLFICVVELVKVIPVMSMLELAAFSVADSSPICTEK